MQTHILSVRPSTHKKQNKKKQTHRDKAADTKQTVLLSFPVGEHGLIIMVPVPGAKWTCVSTGRKKTSRNQKHFAPLVYSWS